MNVTDYLTQVAQVAPSGIPDDDGKVYVSDFDGSYITRVGMEGDIAFLAEREITEQLTHGVGFSPKDGKWYGWSHRAIYGFEVGSTCRKGDCHYVGSSLDEQREAAIEFWKGEWCIDVRCTGISNTGDDKYFDIEWDYTDEVPNKKLRGTVGTQRHYIKPLGRGEWDAVTMEDAKQMAIDFNKGVS